MICRTAATQRLNQTTGCGTIGVLQVWWAVAVILTSYRIWSALLTDGGSRTAVARNRSAVADPHRFAPTDGYPMSSSAAQRSAVTR
jgi:hypothetical protein